MQLLNISAPSMLGKADRDLPESFCMLQLPKDLEGLTEGSQVLGQLRPLVAWLGTALGPARKNA